MKNTNTLFPWNNHYMDWDESVMGRLMMIPNFYSDSELEYLRNMAVSVGEVSSEVYPNRRISNFDEYPTSALVSTEDSSVEMMTGVITDKIDWLWSNWEAFYYCWKLESTMSSNWRWLYTAYTEQCLAKSKETSS